MDTCQAVFEKIYKQICESICRKFEVADRLQMKGDPYPAGAINGLFEALHTVAVYMDVDTETLDEIRALEGF